MGVLGIFLSLGALIYLAYRGISVLFLAPIMAIIACLFHPGTPLLATYTQIFMPALGAYLLQYFPIFILGSIFGKIMNDSGAALSIANFITRRLGAHHAMLSVVMSCALLTYGGVSLFVVAFTIYPIALKLFQQANIPRRLIPAAIALGSFTFTMTALPGTPAIQNAIPMPVFGTTAFAAPFLGITAALIMFIFGMWWLLRREKQLKQAGEKFELGEEALQNPLPTVLPSLTAALLPLFMVVVLNYLFSNYVFPNFDHSYLSEARFGNVPLQKVVGLWSLISSLTLALITAVFLYRKNFHDLTKSLNEGSLGSMLPIFNTASEVGFGATIAALSSFELIKSFLVGILPQFPVVSLAISVNALAAITGSASGGLSIALNSLGETYKQLAHDTGVSLEIMHRVASVACSGLDALPHNGAVITLLAICGLTHRSSYMDIFMTAAVGTSLANVAIVLLATMM